MAPAVVVQGGADTVVRPRNGDRVAEQWLAQRAASGQDDPVVRRRAVQGRTADGRAYDVVRWYTARGRKVLEYRLVHGLGHAWSGGGRDVSFSDPRGPRATTLIWAFLRLHSLDRHAGRPARAAGA
jgi:poly(3-hydroxybutyrate) depolymerase